MGDQSGFRKPALFPAFPKRASRAVRVGQAQASQGEREVKKWQIHISKYKQLLPKQQRGACLWRLCTEKAPGLRAVGLLRTRLQRSLQGSQVYSMIFDKGTAAGSV